MQMLFLAMALYPEVQKKAQAEIDAVIGQNRLPDFHDRPSLPYINAIVKESSRWNLVVPLGRPFFIIIIIISTILTSIEGIPHMSTTDSSLYSIVSCLLAVYDIKPPVDDQGNTLHLKPEFTSGSLT